METPHCAHMSGPSTIDISPFIKLEAANFAERAFVIDSIRSACLDRGFFLITGHGISSELQQRALDWAKRFFDLPLEEKSKLSETKSFGMSHRGYQGIGGEALEASTLPDLKEGFQIGIEKDLSHPDCLRQRMLTGPNVWPEMLGADFKDCMLEYFNAVRTVSLKMMRILALTLEIDYDRHFAPVCDDSLQAIRLLHYPPQPLSASLDQLGIGAHTDFGAVTCLLTDGVSGLQVYDEGVWTELEYVPGALIVNLGDIFSKLTAGVYKSTLHRVVNHTPLHRYSIPCFLDGSLDATIRSLIDGPIPEIRNMTVEEHMLERFTAARGRGKSDAVH